MVEPLNSGPECALCDIRITEANDSYEHVIPNSIGGRVKTRGFLCEDCNNATGESWDAELARQMNPLCLFFGIVRDHGAPPRQLFETTAGERLFKLADGSFMLEHPSYTETSNGSSTRIDIVARSKREARRILAGIKRKYPSAAVEGVLDSATVTTSYPKGAVRFDIAFGGELAGRSLVKTVAAFAHHSGIPMTGCGAAAQYLRNPSANACFGYYYEDDLVVVRPPGIPFHCVAVSGNPSTGLLLGYVEYFGVQRIVTCLSETYHGGSFDRVYAVDPMTGQEINLSVRLPFSAADIADIYNYKKFPDGALQQAFAGVVHTGLRNQFEREKARVIRDAVTYAFAHCGAKEGDMLTDEQMRKLPGLVTQRMMPFILYQVRRGPRDD